MSASTPDTREEEDEEERENCPFSLGSDNAKEVLESSSLSV